MTQPITDFILYKSGVDNAGENCWGPCTQGSCDWCGPEGMCCRQGWQGDGCDGYIGGNGFHACVASKYF